MVTLKSVSQCKVVELGAGASAAGVPGEIPRVEGLSEPFQKWCYSCFPHCPAQTPGKYLFCCSPNVTLPGLPKDHVGVGQEGVEIPVR